MVDQEALADALRSLGMLYGARSDTLAEVARESEPAAAVRAYIMRERPHLLASYDLETLVGLVLEQFRPAR